MLKEESANLTHGARKTLVDSVSKWRLSDFSRAVGAAEEEPGQMIYHEENFFGMITVSSYRFSEYVAAA
jgi:hypothetical protein